MLFYRQTGCISAVVPISETRLVYVAELPLETLCKTQDTFRLPDLHHTNSNNNNLTDSVKDGEIIKPTGKENSVTEALFNIPRNPDVSFSLFCETVIHWFTLRHINCP